MLGVLGTSTSQLAQMTPVAQLDYVKAFIQQRRYRLQSPPNKDPTTLVGLYLVIFAGNGMFTGQAGSTIVFSE